jgi:hypothetical protein
MGPHQRGHAGLAREVEAQARKISFGSEAAGRTCAASVQAAVCRQLPADSSRQDTSAGVPNEVGSDLRDDAANGDAA